MSPAARNEKWSTAIPVVGASAFQFLTKEPSTVPMPVV
jgi:hypothetical protein